MIDLQETHKHCAMPRTRNWVEIKSEESFLLIFMKNFVKSYVINKNTAEQKCLLHVLQIRLFFEDHQLFLQKSQLYRAPLTGGVAKTIRQNK